ncbi:hypothetical protein C8R42DRAFT_716208 [Lentinula raphanica]|nr:hypothetical protein C8R42DRAFT_716208 [Lentinula raphanica]
MQNGSQGLAHLLCIKPTATGASLQEGRSLKSSKGCAWDGCPAKVLKDCADLADWVAKEQNKQGFVNLKGGEGLPKDAKYQKGLVKERFEQFFSENPTARTWILDIPAPSSPPPKKAGLDISQHTAYTLQGYQGPHMLATAAAYAMQNAPSEPRSQRSEEFVDNAAIKVNATKGDQLPIVQAADPEPSVPIPQQIVLQSKTTKPIIGKLPKTYVPLQERNLGAPPKDDTKNYRYQAPIETEQAVERVVSTGLQSLVTIRQDDLLALALDYRKRVKEEMVELPFSVDFNDYGPAEEGDKYYVAKETHPIRGVNAMVQVVDTPAYDFLLGRPFEVLMQATYKNFYLGDQHITLVHPNTSKAVTIPTLPREPPRFKKEDGRELQKGPPAHMEFENLEEGGHAGLVIDLAEAWSSSEDTKLCKQISISFVTSTLLPWAVTQVTLKLRYHCGSAVCPHGRQYYYSILTTTGRETHLP